MSDLVGKQFGNYCLIRFLGEGSFAEVYLGEHDELATFAAIKVLRAHLTRVDTLAFKTEARTIAHLKHPNIVRVLEFGTTEGISFLVMDYAPNGTLRECHPKGTRLPPNTVVSYVNQIASALQYAHDRKVIHRDVKPENMLLGSENEILLSDFGLATIARSTQSLNMVTLEMAGTPYYMAPEQIQGKTRIESDQYALGVIVYDWISGTPPFSGSLRELIAQHQFTDPPPLQEKVPGFPLAIEQVVLKALAKKPEERYSSVKEFAGALEQAILLRAVAVQSSTKTPPTSGYFSEKGPTVASSEAFGKFVLPSQLPGVPPTPPPELQRVPASSPSQTPSQNISRRKFPRRELVKWGVVIGIGAVTVATVIDLAVHAFGSTNNTVSTTIAPHHPTGSTQPFGTLLYPPYEHKPSAVFSVAWSPDGKRIASGWQDKTARVWDALTRNNVLQYTRHSGYVKTVVWSPNSRYIASGGLDHTVRIWDATSGADVLTSPYTRHTAPVRSVAWSERGLLIASGGEDKTVQVWNASTGIDILYSPFTGHNGTVFSVAWSPDGTRIASASADSTVKVWNVLTGQNIFTYRRHQKGVRVVAWSHDGRFIASGSEDMTVQVWDVFTGGNAQIYRKHTADVWGVSWSPDGRYIASGSFDSTVQVWHAT